MKLSLPLCYSLLVSAVFAAAASTASAEDPVLDRYKPGWFSGAIRYDRDLKFSALKETALHLDVKAGRAIFTLEGLGEHRIWNLPEVPTYVHVRTSPAFGERTRGYACQSEEIKVGNTWRRYVGVVSEKGTAVVPADLVEMWLPDPDNFAGMWQQRAGGFDFSLNSPNASPQGRDGPRRTIVPTGSIPIQTHIRNRRAATMASPGDLHRRSEKGVHSFRNGISMIVLWAPFDPKRSIEGYPQDKDFKPVRAKYVTHDVDREESVGPPLAPGADLEAWSFDLHELFEIDEPGDYWYWYEIDSTQLGLEGDGGSGRSIESFVIGVRPEAWTAEQLNAEMGVLGGKDAEPRLRKIISDELQTPAPDVQGLPALPPDFPAFEREGFMGGNMSGDESDFLQLSISNSELRFRIRKCSASSIRAEFERRMKSEKEIPALRLLYASIAAGAESQDGALEILESLKSSDYDTVLNAQSAIVKLLYARDGPPPNWVVQLAMATVDDDRFVTGMKNPDRVLRISYLAAEEERVVLALGDSKCTQALPLLIERVRKSDASRMYVMALGAMGDERAVPVLMEFLTRMIEVDDDGTDRLDHLIRALAHLRAKECVPLLINHLQSESSLKALELIHDLRAVEPLESLIAANAEVLSDGKPVSESGRERLLGQAKITVAVLKPGDAVPRLCALLEDRALDEFQHSDVIGKLSDLGDARAVPFLVKVIQRDKDGYRLYWALGSMRSFRCPEAVDSLIDCVGMDFKGMNAGKLAYEPEMFTARALEGLKELTGQDFPADAARWKAWWDEHREGFQFRDK